MYQTTFNWGFAELLKIPIRTMIFNQQTPKNQTFKPICETYEKLKLIEKQLGRMNLLNNKYLYKRNSIYYFSIKLNNQTIKKSLQTTNFVYANILKYKIIYRLDKMDIKYNLNNMFIVQRAGDCFIMNFFKTNCS